MMIDLRDDLMSGDELKKLYVERDELENRIEKERSERERHGINGMSPDHFEISIERETLLEEKLANVLSKIESLESQSKNIVPFGNGKQNDFINSIDEDGIIKDALGKMGYNPNSDTKVEIKKDTTIKVIEDLGNNEEDVKIFKKSDLESIHTSEGNKIAHGKSSNIDFTLKQNKDGRTVNETTKHINVSLNDDNHRLGDGRQTGGNNVVYNEVKQIGSSDANEIVIDAKDVKDTKNKGFDKRKPQVKVKYGRNNINYRD